LGATGRRAAGRPIRGAGAGDGCAQREPAGAAGGVSPGAARVYLAFGATIALWLAFTVMEEVFLQYAIEGTHVQPLIGALVTVHFLVQLPG